MIQNLAYELSVFAKAVQHKNLSAAAIHIGLSQPQLSRLISKIETELNVVLLDRSARRKSGWTPFAQDLALTFQKGLGRLESDILSLAKDAEVHELHVASLEGLSAIATKFARDCFDKLKMKIVYLDILDFRDLDAQFLGGNLDLIFTVKPPGKQKFSHMIEVGHQQMEKINSDKETLVVSPFEFVGLEKSDSASKQALVSNSLAFRENWLRNIGGTGVLPTDTKPGRGKGHYAVYLVGADLISPRLWENITALFE